MFNDLGAGSLLDAPQRGIVSETPDLILHGREPDTGNRQAPGETDLSSITRIRTQGSPGWSCEPLHSVKAPAEPALLTQTVS
jgi:hypothetical protein